MQDAINFLNQDYYLNYPLIYALMHGAELIGANQHGVALLFPDPDFLANMEIELRRKARAAK